MRYSKSWIQRNACIAWETALKYGRPTYLLSVHEQQEEGKAVAGNCKAAFAEMAQKLNIQDFGAL